MPIKNYDELNNLEIDVIREIGSIGTGNAATALSGVLSKPIEMTMPEVQIMDYNEAIDKMGGPETIVVGVMVRLSGEINGMMLYIQKLDFINLVLESILTKTISSYDELGELETSALIEIGNIMISSYMTAISSLAGISIDLSVPDMNVNMLGGILSVPMVEYGYETDKIMSINGRFTCDSKEVYSNLLLLPDVKSLDYLFKKLGVQNE